MDIKDFIEGQRDCRDGYPAKWGASGSYNSGYSAQYQLEAAQTWFSEQQEKRIEHGHK